jgi:hypothetical protein
MRVVKVLLPALAGLALAPAALGQGSGDPLDGPAACSAVVTKGWKAPRPPRNLVEVWVECNLQVMDLTLRANRRLAGVGDAPLLYGPDPGDRLSCRARGRLRAA